MTRKRNRGVVYSGTLKNALRRPSARMGTTPGTRRVKKTTGNYLVGGPMAGQRLMLSDHSCTLPITLAGQTGRYLHGEWVPA